MFLIGQDKEWRDIILCTGDDSVICNAETQVT
jgi:hypothetical protein